MTSFSGILLSLSWCLDPEPVSDLRFHPLQKQQCSCTCSCRFEFSPTSGKMYSPLFLIKIVLAITLSSCPTSCLHTCFSPSIVGLTLVTQHLMKKSGNNTSSDTTCFSLGLPVKTMLLVYTVLDCPFHNHQGLRHGWAPILKSCLASGHQAPPGRLPPLPRCRRKGKSSYGETCFPLVDGLLCPAPHPPLPCGLASISLPLQLQQNFSAHLIGLK